MKYISSLLRQSHFNVMIFSNHMAAAFLPPSSLSTSPYIVQQSDHHHVHDQHKHHHEMMRRLVSFSRGMTENGYEFNNGLLNGGGDDELSDDGSQMLEEKKKKKRLSMEQVMALERSFETGNKLELERKSQLARSLGLQPRQVAIWFQNRRARWKTKKLERDYEVLRQKVEVLKADNNVLLAQNEMLHVEIMSIKARRDMNEPEPTTGKNPAAAEGSHWSNNGSDVNPVISRTTLIDSLMLDQNDLRVNSTNLCNIFGYGVVVADSHHGFWPWTMTDVDQRPLHP